MLHVSNPKPKARGQLLYGLEPVVVWEPSIVFVGVFPKPALVTFAHSTNLAKDLAQKRYDQAGLTAVRQPYTPCLRKCLKVQKLSS